MKKHLLILIFAIPLLGIGQNKNGTLFYSTVERTTTFYKINIDLFEVGRIAYIEIQLVDENKNELTSDMAELLTKNGKYYVLYQDMEKPILPENINLKLNNEYDDINYPQINIKLYDKSLKILDYSQTIFY